jgi:uncharacterized alkaline shock family protein YloU
VSTPETARSTSQTARTTAESARGTTATAAAPVPAPRRAAAELSTEHGNTTIADIVVAKIVALATREIDGVYAMGTGSARMMGAVRQRIPGAQASAAQGVAVEVGERQAAADIDLVVEYGVSIPDLAASVRNNVINLVERLCGLEVTEVNVGIDDIHLPGEQDTDTTPRVQ